jgi:hypothetical protein
MPTQKDETKTERKKGRKRNKTDTGMERGEMTSHVLQLCRKDWLE